MEGVKERAEEKLGEPVGICRVTHDMVVGIKLSGFSDSFTVLDMNMERPPGQLQPIRTYSTTTNATLKEREKEKKKPLEPYFISHGFISTRQS